MDDLRQVRRAGGAGAGGGVPGVDDRLAVEGDMPGVRGWCDVIGGHTDLHQAIAEVLASGGPVADELDAATEVMDVLVRREVIPPPDGYTPNLTLIDAADCAHEVFAASVDVNRITRDNDGPVEGFSVDVTVRCVGCGEPMVFFGAGLPVGMLRDRPCLSVDGTELRAPCRPMSSDVNTGLGLAGFVMRAQEGMDRGN